MTDSTNSDAPPDRSYLLVLRCRSGARLRPDHAVVLQDIPTEACPMTLTVRTRYEQQGLEMPIPRELAFEVRCRADNLEAAISSAGPLISGLAAMLAFTTNVSVESPRIHVGYDATPGVERREFFETFLPDETGLLSPGRWVDGPAFIDVVNAIGKAAERSRLARAISQYEVSLRYWNTGALIMAFSHLYMAAEALTNAVERSRRSELGITEEEHARPWGGYQRARLERMLLNFARREYIFGGDRELYDTARNASDHFEHGSADLSHRADSGDRYH